MQVTFADKLRELRERATKGPWRESSDGVGAIEDSSENTLYFDEGTATTENNRLLCFLVNHAAEIEALVRAAEYAAGRLRDGGVFPVSGTTYFRLSDALVALDQESEEK